MIKITKSNMEGLLQECLEIYSKHNYSDECFSTHDAMLEKALNDDIDTILHAISKEGIDLKKHFGNLLKEYGMEMADLEKIENEPEDFETYVYCINMEHFLGPDWVSADKMPPRKTKYYTEVDTGVERFKYQKWDTSKEAIDTLFKESIVANKFIDILNDVSTNYYNFSGEKLYISSLEVIRDIFAPSFLDNKDGSSDCSSFLIELSHSIKDEYDNKILFLVKAGGFYDDIIIAKEYYKDNYEIEHVVPLKDVNPLSIRDYSLIKDDYEKGISDFVSYR